MYYTSTSNILNQQRYFVCKKVENLLWMCFRRKSGKVSFLFVERKLYMEAFVGDKLNDAKFREKTKLLFHKN